MNRRRSYQAMKTRFEIKRKLCLRCADRLASREPLSDRGEKVETVLRLAHLNGAYAPSYREHKRLCPTLSVFKRDFMDMCMTTVGRKDT